MYNKLKLLTISYLLCFSYYSFAADVGENKQQKIEKAAVAKVQIKTELPALADKQFDDGSGIKLASLTAQQIDNLALLGKVWGFLKYHHPMIAQGQYNWDYQLFRLLPRYLMVSNNQDRDQLLSSWITSVGEVPQCTRCQPTSSVAVLKPDFSWFNKFNISASLTQQLKYLYDNRHQGPQYYITTGHNVGNPLFVNENSYESMIYPDDGFRLLALYRYWNMIHYFFPSKHLTDTQWSGVLTQYITKFVNAQSALEYQQSVVELLGEINDGHAYTAGVFVFQQWKGQNYPPVELKFVRGQLVVVGHYKSEFETKSGLKIGDVITQINGKNIKEIVTGIQRFYPASNQATRLSGISLDMMRSNDKQLEISYIRDGVVADLILDLYSPEIVGFYSQFSRDEQGKSFELLPGNIGYINLEHIQASDVDTIKQQLRGTKGAIIDIRNYPRAFVVHTLGRFFTAQPKEFAKFTVVNINNPGEINFDHHATLSGELLSYQNKVIVIINQETQSMAEYTAMAFRAGDNTLLIGSTTAGADGNTSRIVLPGGIATAISGIGVYYPDGTQTQRVGIVPDIEVLPTIAGIKERRDELLEKAINLINL